MINIIREGSMASALVEQKHKTVIFQIFNLGNFNAVLNLVEELFTISVAFIFTPSFSSCLAVSTELGESLQLYHTLHC